MADQKFDIVVIGSGPGGYVAAIRAAQLGLKTAVIEKENVGGRCLNEACIPAKAILRVAEVMDEVNHAGQFGISVSGAEFDWAGAGKHRDKVVKTLTGGVAMLLEKNKIEYIDGFATLTDDGNVRVGAAKDGDEIETDKILLACGSVSKPILDLQFGDRILDTAATWLLEEQPKRLAVIGAGASGTEIASAFGRLGTEVALIEALDQILPLEDEDIAKACAREIKKQNVNIQTGAKVESVEAGENSVKVTVNGDTQEFDYLTIAAGRGPDVEGLGLEDAGVKVDDRGLIEVDGHMRTSREGIWAIGDMVPGPALAHKASDEGIIAVEDAAGLATHPIDYPYVPRVTFCSPQVASFGLTEAQAKEAGVETDERGLVKVDGALKTTKEGVWAIGDIVPGPALAHKASDEGIIAVESAAGMDTHPIDYDFIPRVTFCSPQVASFGLTEAQAKEAGHDVVTGKVPMGAVGAPTVYGDRGGMVKIIGDKRYGELLGGHIVSAKAADLIQELVMARDLEGGYPEVARSVHAHPSFAEAVLEAARATDGWLIHG